MSFEASSAYISAIDTSPINLIHLVDIERTDGTVLRYHDQHNASLTSGGETYVRGLNRQSILPIRYLTNGGVSNTGFVLVLNNDGSGLVEVDTLLGEYSRARVVISYAMYDDPSDVVAKFYGYVSDVEIAQERWAKIEVRSILGIAKRAIPVEITEECPAILGDTEGFFKCNVDMTLYTDTFEITSVTNGRVWNATYSSARDDGDYVHGLVTFTTGNLAGQVLEVRRHVGSEIRTWLAATGPLPEVGDTGTITVGCDKRFATCVGTFDNGLNFQGYPWIVQADMARRQSHDRTRVAEGEDVSGTTADV